LGKKLSLRYLIDTNVLIHTLDARDLAKQQRAIDTLSSLERLGNAALAAQVLAEYANVSLKKFGMEANQVYQHVQDYELSFIVYPLSPAVVLEAVRGVRDHQLSYFDAQIWAVAKLNQVPVIVSEDFNSGATLEGVHFLNPFATEFNPNTLV
jgi:predicted nucleic acid-binding protein